MLRTYREQAFYHKGVSVSSKPKAASKSEVIAVDGIFGPPPLLPGEDSAAYDILLARVSADVKPKDIIEKIWVRDIVDRTWDVFRLRKVKGGLASQNICEALEDGLKRCGVEESPGYPSSTEGLNIKEFDNSLCYTLPYQWVKQKPDVVAWINELEANKDISMNEVMASAFVRNLDRIERVDKLLAAAESRRNAVLREIERRREIAFARSLREAVQQAEDAEFTIVEPNSNVRTSKSGKKAA